MQPWSGESPFHHLFDYDSLYLNHVPLVRPIQISQEPKGSNNRTACARTLCTEGIGALNRLACCFEDIQHLNLAIRQLRDTVRLVQRRLGTKISSKDQYRLIYPVSAWFTKNETSSLIDLSNKNPHVLVFLLYLYAVVVTLAVALPSVDLPFFALLRIRGIFEMRIVLSKEDGFLCGRCEAHHTCGQLMAFPLNSVYIYQLLMH